MDLDLLVASSEASTSNAKRPIDEAEKERRKKRPRQVTSCTMCVKRKTKCDKGFPCAACIKRGDPSGCQFEGYEEVRTGFATFADLQLLQNQFKVLQETVDGLVANSKLIESKSSGGSWQHTSPQLLHQVPLTKPKSIENQRSIRLDLKPKIHQFDLPVMDAEATVAAALQKLSQGALETLSPYITPLPSLISRNGKQTESKYSRRMSKLIAAMPTKEISNLLIQSFVERVDWHLHVLHLPMFKKECELVFKNLENGNEDNEISATWYATYFMVLSLGLYYLPSSLSPFSEKETLSLPLEWRDVSEKALSLGDWSGIPQARSVQAILMMAFLWYNIGEIDRLTVWVGAGVRVAQSLGLHTVDKKPVNFSNDTFQVNSIENLSFFNQELGTRLWWYLCVFDWDVSYRCRNMSVLRAQDFSTPTPLNLNDEDISNGLKKARTMDIPTVVNYEILLSELVFLQQQWVVPRKTPAGLAVLPLETIISIDKLVREKATRFADFFQISKRKDLAVVKVDQDFIFVKLQRLNLNMEIQCRLLRLHRRCLFDSSQSPEAIFSINASRQSSSHLLTIARLFFETCDFAAKIWWIPAYSILASISLLLSNSHLLSLPPSTSLPTDIETSILLVKSSLKQLKQSSPISDHTQAGIEVIETLLNKNIEFDVGRYRNILDSVAKAGIACSPEETKQMKLISEDLSGRGGGMNGNHHSEGSVLGLLAANGVGGARDVLGGLEGLDLTLPFETSNFSSLETGEGDYDDFFRSLGFVAPVGKSSDGANGDLFGGGSGWANFS